MANHEHVAILEQGFEIWNQWRKEHLDTKPDLIRANLREAILNNADLVKADLSGANLREVGLIRANLSYANLIRADLSGANLSGANLREVGLIRANLSYANLIRADLSGADLSGANLRGANLSGARLRGANLNGAYLDGAHLGFADLSDTKLVRVILREAILSNADLSGADLSGAVLSGAVLVETNLSGAILTQCSVYKNSIWDVQLEGAKQGSLVITEEGEPTIEVDNLEVAQFISLLLNYKKLRDVFNTVTERGVLLLGRFGGDGLGVLHAIADRLREENYLPIIFDFERPQDRDYTETVKTLTGLARFVIVDLSGPSVPQELYATVPDFAIPFIPIIEKGKNSYSMFEDLFKFPWVLRPPIEFATVEELLERMPAEVLAQLIDRGR